MKEKLCGIYCIENLMNNKKYIGYSCDINRRWKAHISKLKSGKHDNDHLQNAWDLYEEDGFSFYIIEECEREELQNKEIFYIDKLNTISPDGYNLTFGGDGNPNPTAETRRKYSKTWKGKKHTTETKIKMSIAQSGENHPMYGKHHSNETKIKLSNALSGENHPMYGKFGENHQRFGKVHNDETKSKISKSLSGENHYNYGKQLSTKHKNKISNSIRGENNPNSKLTEKDVIEIKKLLKEGKLLQREIADLYGVQRPLIVKIKTGKAWKHLPD